MSKESAMAALTGNPVPAPISSDTGQTSSPTIPQLQSEPFHQLAKKEAEIVKQRLEINKERDLINTEKEKIRSIQTKYQEYETKKKENPIEAMKMLGFSETDVINYLANQQPEELTPEQKAIKAAEAAADAKIKTFEEAQLKKIQQEQKQADQSLIKGWRENASKAIQANPEKYEYCAHYGSAAEELVYETVLAVVAESKGQEVVTPEEAVQMVEQYYEEQDKLMNKLKKRNPAVQVQAPASTTPQRSRTLAPPTNGQEPQKPVVTHSRTLHNGATSTVAAMRQTRNETHVQKRERLIEALRNGVKP